MKITSPYSPTPKASLAMHVCAWSCGAMDNASDYGSEDSRFESWQDRKLLLTNPLEVVLKQKG